MRIRDCRELANTKALLPSSTLIQVTLFKTSLVGRRPQMMFPFAEPCLTMVPRNGRCVPKLCEPKR